MMRCLYNEFQIGQTRSDRLRCSYYLLLLGIYNLNKRNFYERECVNLNNKNSFRFCRHSHYPIFLKQGCKDALFFIGVIKEPKYYIKILYF